MNEKELVRISKKIADNWNKGVYANPVHLSGGNEKQLLRLFKRIKKEDYVFSTHRPHYHYLLKGGTEKDLLRLIKQGLSMTLLDPGLRFYSSGIVAGLAGMAVGVAVGIKRNKGKHKVWCFIGDGGEDNGNFLEALKYSIGHKLPITFIIEDNNRSVKTPKKVRQGQISFISPKKYLLRYSYVPTWPHVGTGKRLEFKGDGVVM